MQVSFSPKEPLESWQTRSATLTAIAREWLASPATATIGQEMLRLVDGVNAAIDASDVERVAVLSSYLGAAHKAGQLALWVLDDLAKTPLADREMKRQSRQKENAAEKKSARQNRISLAHELLAKYPDVRGNTKTIYREIGQAMQIRLGLSIPVQPRTVRRYLSRSA